MITGNCWNDGLFISIEAGGIFIAGYFIFAGVFDIGYQYISPKGFVFTPAGLQSPSEENSIRI